MVGTGDGASAAVVWDDVTMTASGFQIHVPANDPYAVEFTATTTSQSFDQIYPAGSAVDAFIALSAPQPVQYVTNWKGRQGISFPWLLKIGMGSSY